MRRKNDGKSPMAKVQLDYRYLKLPTALRTVQDLIVHVQTRVLPKDRVLQRVVLDGRQLSEEDESEAHSLKLSDYDEIELQSRRVLELALEGLSAAREVVPAVAHDLLAAAQTIREGQLSEGLAILYDCLAMIDWYLDLIGAVESMVHEERPWLRYRGMARGGALPVPDATGEKADDAAPPYATFAPKEELAEKLQRLDAARKAQNLPVLADLIEDEIAPVVALWAEELPAILAQMQAETAEA